MRRALVTGGRGFVGAWLCGALLERGVEVVSFDRRTPRDRPSTLALLGIETALEERTGELCDGEALRATMVEAGTDTVFHLAAETIVGTVHSDPIGAFETNVRGTWTLLHAALQSGVERVVVASSDKAYGAHEELPYREGFALRPTAPYEASKAAADLIARSYWPSYGLPVAVTRFANIYGVAISTSRASSPRWSARRSTAALRSCAPTAHRSAICSTSATRSAPTWRSPRRSIATRSGGEAFNAGGERPYGVLEVVESITRLAGTGVSAEIRGTGNPAGEIDRQYVDASKLRDLCGWSPATSLEQGLTETIEWYRANPQIRPDQP